MNLKNYFFISFLFFLNFVVYAESTKPLIETGVKVQKTEYIPFDYSRNVTDAYWNQNVEKLRNNTKVINPFFFIYKNLEQGIGIEFEYSRIQIERANYDKNYLYSNGMFTGRNYLRNNERSDYKLNFFIYPFESIKELFAIGAGIRKIDRFRNISEGNFTAEEKVVAYGPQIVLKSKIPITDQLSLNLGLDIYHTQGKRNYYYLDSQSYSTRAGEYSYVEQIKGSAKTIGIFQGYEANIALKYNFMENYNLAFGYNYNYAYFKYENLRDSLSAYNSLNGSYYFENSKVSNGKEIMRGFYISASTIF